MNESQANKIVLISAGVLVALTFAQRQFNPEGFDLYKNLWGIGALTLALSVTADFVPEVAGPIALLVVSAATVKKGHYIKEALGAPVPQSKNPQVPAGAKGPTGTNPQSPAGALGPTGVR